MARFPFLDHDGPIAFAHRGGSAERPENTWASFSHALELGYTYLETDVHSTADGVVAVIHDPVLDRVSDRQGRVGDLPWLEVAAATVGEDQRVPRLDDLAAWPDVRWNIDAKHDGVVVPLLDVLHRAGAVDRVCVTSFSDRRLARLRRLAGPSLCTALGPQSVAGLRVASLLPRLGRLGRRWQNVGAAQVPVRQGRVPVVDRRFVTAAHQAGLAVHVWTVDDRAEMGHLLDLGVDGLMTDAPTLLREVMGARGLWA